MPIDLSMSTTRAETDVLVARQPIYDPSLRVVAYQLLVQHRDGSSAIDEQSAISELGLNLVVGHPAFVGVSRGLLLEGHATALPRDRIVLQLDGDVQVDRAATTSIRELVAAGSELSVVHGHGNDDLLPLAKVIEVDVSAGDRGVIRNEVPQLRHFGAKLLARNVEEHDDVQFCTEVGFDLLQGYFFCRPRVVSESGIHVNRLALVQTLGELQNPDIDFDSLQEIIGRDVGLSYNLLRFINSAFFALPRRVESLRDALVLLGAMNVRKWATLMTLAQVDDKPQELVITGLVRARMCELLARAYHHKDTEAYFTAGLFSVVDALTDTSLVELLASLPLSREIIQALLNYEGPKGRVLRAVIAYERGAFAELDDLPPTRAPLGDLYQEAVEWATEACAPAFA
jgi:EAL and modified HD-GYP domain-containing signal transduction protein